MGHLNLEVFLSQIELEIFKEVESPLGYSNLSKEEWKAVRSLANDRNIVIKKADKRSFVVIWDRSDYIMEAEKKLNDKAVYKDVNFDKDLIPNLTGKSNRLFESLKRRQLITEKEFKYFRFEFKKTCNLGKLYLLPKIHKRLSNVPGRPVISNCGAPTEKVSEFLDSHMQPIMRKGWSYIKDSQDFISKSRKLGKIPDYAILVTADVVGLYRSIPHNVGLRALKEALDKREQKKIPTEDLVQMADFVLKNNFFGFNNQIKQQITGTAIGIKYAPTYACIFMDKVVTEFLETQRDKPFWWVRYIDDIFLIWTHGQEKPKVFLEDLNKFHPNLKFTCDSSEENVAFLDLKVKLKQGKIETDLHVKSTDRHQYLHYTSSHPEHTKRSIVFSQGLSVSRICSQAEDFRKHTTELRSWFYKTGYPKGLVEREMRKVKRRKEREKKRVPFVITYNPSLKNIGRIINQNLYILCINEEVKTVFTPAPMISFRSARKLSSYLVRAKLYPLERTVGSVRCKGKRCQICHNVKETKTFTSTTTGKIFKINHKLNCNDTCLVYLLTCNVCLKQCVGQTVEEFRYRWNNYKNNGPNYQEYGTCTQQHLFEHFSEEGHHSFLEDVSITLIDKTDPSNPLQRENYWRCILKTMAPWGLNIEDCV